MKKIFTLTMGLLLAVALMAADRRPVVTINSNKNLKIVVDGRSYFGSDMTLSLSNLQNGRHTIKVYEMKKGFFQNRERMIGSSNFFLNGKDVVISIDWNGNITIKEKKNYKRFDNDNDRNDRDRNDRNDRDRNDGPGRRDDDRRF